MGRSRPSPAALRRSASRSPPRRLAPPCPPWRPSSGSPSSTSARTRSGSSSSPRGDGWWKRTDEIYEAVRIGEGLAATGALRRGADGARAGDDRRLRALLPRPPGSSATRSTRSRRARSATPPTATTSSTRARGRRACASRVLVARGGGALRLPRGGQLDDAGRRRRARPRRRLDAARPRRRPARARARLVAARRGADDRALPRRRRARPSASSSTTLRDARRGASSRAPLAARSRGARLVGDRRHGAQPRGRRPARGRAARVRRPGLRDRRAMRSTTSSSALAALPPAERGRVPGIKPARADLILAGALVVQTRARGRRLRRRRGRPRPACARASSSSACSRGRRPAAVRRRPPRERAQPRRAVRRRRPRTREHVARLALGLFDELAAAGLHAGDPVERELLWAACAAARHRHGGRLRRPPQALALPDPQRRAAGLHAARGRADRPGRALPPQGHAGAGRRSRR